MRQGVGAGFPHRGQQANALVRTSNPAPQRSSAQLRSNVSRFFIDLRGALRLSPHQAAAHLMTRPETIDALEGGHVELLPPWPETAGIVVTYAAMANIDGRPVLRAIAELLAEAGRAKTHPIVLANAVAPGRQGSYPRLPVEHIRRAGTAFANGAKRLPQQVRERPERAFYAVSLPLGILFLMLNTSVLSHVPGPLVRMTAHVAQFMRVHFAPVREGHRWIEVDEPRSRRGDKLRIDDLRITRR